MNIEIGKEYNIKVVDYKIDDKGNKIYACRNLNTDKLFWTKGISLGHNIDMTPIQEEFIKSEKQFINIVACGCGAVTTTAFFENIINSSSKDNYFYGVTYKQASGAFDDFRRLCGKKGIELSLDRRTFRVSLPSGNRVKFSYNTNTVGNSGDHYLDTGWDDKLNLEMDNLCRFNKYYFSCYPSNIVSGYSTTTVNGYYEVASCDHPLLKYVINLTGKIPKATPVNIEKFLKCNTNLVTGYNARDNVFLNEDFTDVLESLDPCHKERLLGEWVKL